MQKPIKIKIDTITKKTVVDYSNIRRGDTLLMTIKMYQNSTSLSVTGQTIKLILRKSDGYSIEKTITSTDNIALDEQATLSLGAVKGEIQLIDANGTSISNWFTYEVGESLADDIVIKSSDDIETLQDIQNIIDGYNENADNLAIQNTLATSNIVDLTTKNSDALATKSVLDTSKTNADASKVALNTLNATATTTTTNLNTSNTTALATKSALDTSNTNANTTKTNLDTLNTTATTTKTNLTTINTTALATKTALDLSNTNATTTKTNLDNANTTAQNNITAMQNFGDVTTLTTNVNAIKTEVETARNGEVSLDARLDKNDVLVESHSTQLSERVKQNTIINGDFRINQRVVTGTVTLVAGQYGHDRWKAGASGCTYTFATNGGITTITITAGSLIQVIEGTNLQTGTYVLSWGGTATGKIGVGSYSASGVSASVTGGANLNIEFGTGTLSNSKLEKGTIVTPFIPLSIGEELALCKRYFEQINTGGARSNISTGLYSNPTALCLLSFSEKRIIPTVTVGGSGGDYTLNGGSTVGSILSTTPTVSSQTVKSVILTVTPNAGTWIQGGAVVLNMRSSNAYVNIDAEL